MNTHSPLFKTLAHLLMAVIWAQPLHSIAANLQLDHQAAGNTQMSAAHNGVPIINIATPNGQGLSHNKFIDYNVGQQGLILNNSTDKLVNTQLGGIILGNSQLNGKAAGIILNEITGGQRSQLKGYTEVAGKQAQVVVANPHGITCNGCGFINTPQATLTTGRPLIEQGRLQGYEVDGGDIEISGAGLNASNVSRFDLITRSAKINAELHANQLNIVTGRNQVAADSLKVTAKDAQASGQPLLAIDSSALGGMYAGAIRLIGTEAGVGVKLAGDMAASTGDIQIDVNGQLSLARAAARDDLAIKAQDSLIEQQLYAGKTLSVKSDVIENKGELLAGGTIALAVGQLNNSGLIEAGVAADATAKVKGKLAIQANNLRNSGVILARQDIAITAQQLDNRAGQIHAEQTVRVSTDNLDNSGQGLLASGQLLDIQAGQVINTHQGVLAGKGGVQLRAEQLDNSNGGAVSSGEGSVQLQLSDALINQQGKLFAAQTMQLSAARLDNQAGTLAAGADASLQLVDTLTNTAGQIAANNLHLTAGQLSNEAGLILAEADMQLQAAGQLSNQAGGEILSGQGLALVAGSVDNQNSRISSEGWLQLLASELRNSRQAVISAYQSLGVDTAVLENLDDSILLSEQAELNIVAERVRNNASLLQAGDSISIQAEALHNQSGNILSGKGDIAIRMGDNSLLVNSGTLAAGKDLLLNTDKLSNQSGLLLAGQTMQLSVSELHNQDADIYAIEDIYIQGRQPDTAALKVGNLSARIEAGQDLLIFAKDIDNKRSVLETQEGKYFAAVKELPCGWPYPVGDCKLGSNGRRNGVWQLTERDKLEVTNSTAAADIMAGRDLAIAAERLENFSSRLSAGRDISLELGQLKNIGVSPYNIELTRIFVSGRKPSYYYYAGLAHNFNAVHAARVQSSSVLRDISRFVGAMESEYLAGRRLVNRAPADESYSALIQAGGAIQIRANQTLENSVIRPSFAYVSGGTREGGQLETLVQLNPQHRERLQQSMTEFPGVAIPQGSQGLFSVQTAPGHSYLIETNPALTQMRQFLGSDYLLDALGLSPDAMQKRLGDGFYEQRLIRDALVARTGQRFIAGIHSDEALFRYLMDNAIASKEALELSVGVSLTAEQVAALTHDIVWLEEHQVMGEQVLVPVLYMAQVGGGMAPGGALIQGQDLALISGGGLNNQGRLQASNSLDIQAHNIANSGQVQAGERLSLLAEDSMSNRHGGILAGQDVELSSGTGDILNERSVTRHVSVLSSSRWETSFADSAARIEASNSLSLSAGRDVQNLGAVLQSGGDMQVTAGRDLSLLSVEERHGISRGSHSLNSQTAQLSSQTLAGGNLGMAATGDLSAVASRIQSGQDMQLLAGNDLTLAAAANESHHYSKSKKSTSQSDRIQQQATQLLSGGSLTALSGKDMTLVSSHVNASKEAYLVAGGKLQLLAEQDVDYSFYEKKKKGSLGRKSYRMNESDQRTAVTTGVSAGTDLLIHGAEAITAQGAQLQAGQQLELQSGGDILLLAAEQGSSQASAKSKSGLLASKGKASSQSQTQLVGTAVKSDNLLINAGQDLHLSAGYLRAEQAMVLQAGRDLELSSGLEYSSQSRKKYSSKFALDHFTLPSLTQRQQAAKQSNAMPQGSYLSAGQMLVSAQRDVGILGSTLISEGNMHIQSGRHLNILATDGSMQSESSSSSKRTGSIGQQLMSAHGQVKSQAKTQADSLQQHASQLASLTGNIDLLAAGNYQQTASSLLAPEGDISIQARQVAIEAGYDQFKEHESRSMSRTALGGSVSIPLLEAARGIQQLSQAQRYSDDSRMQALATATMAMQGYNAFQSAQALSGGNLSGIKISVSLGHNGSKSQAEQQGQSAVPSTLLAGRDIHIKALGAADSDLAVLGSQLSAGRDIHLEAEGNILLQAAENSFSQYSKQGGSGWGVGIGFSLGQQNGFTLDLSANQFAGKADGRDSRWTHTRVAAGRQLHLTSGQDTRLQGAVAGAQQVIAQVGGDLILQSLQDTNSYRSSQSGSGVGVSLCIPPFCGGLSSFSFSQNASKVRGDYASVNQQSGIQAGDGGFQLTVKGHTDLTGALIASSEQAVLNGLNRLETGTLAFRDLANYSNYQGRAAGATLGMSFGVGKDNKAIQDRAEAKTPFAPKLTGSAISKVSGSDTGNTRSGISQAEVVITDVQAQTQLLGKTTAELLAILNNGVRTGDESGGLSKGWNGKQLERVVQANAEIMSTFSQQANLAVSAYVHNKREGLLEQKRNEGNPDKQADIQGQINALNTQGRVMNVIIGALTGQLDSAVAHALLQEAADQMRQYSIESSSRFAGVIIGEDEQGNPLVLSNLSGDSAGVRGDATKLGGVRVDLDLICGKDNGRCKTQEDALGNEILDGRGVPLLQLKNGMVVYDEKKAKISFEEFRLTESGKKMSGLTGGVQGLEGTMAGKPYEPNGFWDSIVESFAGTHDAIGGGISGLYDEQGNTTRGLSNAQNTAYNVWSVIAITPSAPFALAEALPAEAWQALDVLLGRY